MEYFREGGIRRALVVAPRKGDTFDRWLEIRTDESHLRRKLTDYSGMHIEEQYDEAGRLTKLTSAHPGTLSIQYGQGSETLTTSWGVEVIVNMDSQSGRTQSISLTEGGHNASMQFIDGRLSRVNRFNNSVYELAYYDSGRKAGLLQSVHTPTGAKLSLDYTAHGRLASVGSGGTAMINYSYVVNGCMAGGGW